MQLIWIECAERLPQSNEHVEYTHHADGSIRKAWYDILIFGWRETKGLTFDRIVDSPVTHWLKIENILPPVIKKTLAEQVAEQIIITEKNMGHTANLKKACDSLKDLIKIMFRYIESKEIKTKN